MQCDNCYVPPYFCNNTAEFQEQHKRRGIRYRRMVCRQHLEELLQHPSNSDISWKRLGANNWRRKEDYKA